MGMDLFLDTNVITKEEYEKFKKGELYINIYKLTLLPKKDIESTKKIFLFNLISAIAQNKDLETLTKILFEYKNSDINYFYDWCKEHCEEYFDDDEIDLYNLGYDEDILNNYIDYDSWINQKDWCDGYLNRTVEEVENSVILIQASFI